jgi:outer membrane protein assembly factor BamB
MSKRRILIGTLLVLLVLGIAGGVYYYLETRPTTIRGSAKQEFNARDKPIKVENKTPWPTYGFNNERLHVAEFSHRPPYRKRWRVSAGNIIEFPPVIGYRRVYMAQQRGRFFAIDARTGRIDWQKDTGHCSPSSPAVDPHRRVVYQAYMHPLPCAEGASGADGYVVAMNADTGKQLWRFQPGGPVESSLLLENGVLYFGSWDHNIYAVNARTGRKLWSYQADDQVNTSAAFDHGTVFIADDAGSVYALKAATGRLRWKSSSTDQFGSREFFYATPTVAYNRVYVGNTDGTVYAYGEKTGKVRWARPAGSYVYSAAAAYKRTIYVGSYDGDLYALDAATGDVKWKYSASSAIHAAPVVMDGLVYFAACGSCGQAASRSVKHGANGTYAVDADTGKLVWHSSQGKYASPIIADSRRTYLVGRSQLYALTQRKKKPKPPPPAAAPSKP